MNSREGTITTVSGRGHKSQQAVEESLGMRWPAGGGWHRLTFPSADLARAPASSRQWAGRFVKHSHILFRDLVHVLIDGGVRGEATDGTVAADMRRCPPAGMGVITLTPCRIACCLSGPSVRPSLRGISVHRRGGWFTIRVALRKVLAREVNIILGDFQIRFANP